MGGRKRRESAAAHSGEQGFLVVGLLGDWALCASERVTLVLTAGAQDSTPGATGAAHMPHALIFIIERCASSSAVAGCVVEFGCSTCTRRRGSPCHCSAQRCSAHADGARLRGCSAAAAAAKRHKCAPVVRMGFAAAHTAYTAACMLWSPRVARPAICMLCACMAPHTAGRSEQRVAQAMGGTANSQHSCRSWNVRGGGGDELQGLRRVCCYCSVHPTLGLSVVRPAGARQGCNGVHREPTQAQAANRRAIAVPTSTLQAFTTSLPQSAPPTK